MEFLLKWAPHGSKDQKELIEIRRQVLRWPLGLDFTEEELEAESTSWHLGAWLGLEAIGCLVLAFPEPGKAKMRQVAVRPDWQGHRIGQALVHECEVKAREHGAATIELHARANVVPFYERLGYEVRGQEFEEVTLPHFYMWKSITR